MEWWRAFWYAALSTSRALPGQHYWRDRLGWNCLTSLFSLWPQDHSRDAGLHLVHVLQPSGLFGKNLTYQLL